MSKLPIKPTDSVTLKAFRVTKWALERGGRFSGKELRDQFNMSKSRAYKVAAEWREVFGNKPPRRARKAAAGVGSTPADDSRAIVSDSPGLGDRIDLASLLCRIPR
jgi:hypothetical protein